ncbi:MAG: FliO/MopB family protein, partial [Thermoleophilia bacterium]|nr:FliO/MopB family protein [Thermoleophilia bacterium]
AFQTEEEVAKEAAEEPGSGGSFLRMIFGLVVVLGAIYGVHWMLKKWSHARVAGAGVGTTGIIDVVATTPLAAGRSIHLIRVGDELVLVGATEHSITRLGEIGQGSLQSVLGTEASSKFDSLLNGVITAPTPIAQIPAPQGGEAAQPMLQRFVHNLRLSTAR